jgi:hypothetical protein
MEMNMRTEIKNKWVSALRSGEYKQTFDTLRDNYGFCCLGVLCDLYIDQSEDFTEEQRSYWNNAHEFLVAKDPNYDNEVAVLPASVMNWAGMKTSDGTIGLDSLASLNDQGMEFDQIADVIDDKWEVL